MADEMMMTARVAELEGLLRECGEQFRFHEASHRAKILPDLGLDDPLNADPHRKAEVNAALAARVESLLRRETAFQPEGTAPDNASDLMIALQITCCHPGARLLVMGGRLDGRWVLPIDHDVDVIGWAPAPAFPEILMGETRQ